MKARQAPAEKREIVKNMHQIKEDFLTKSKQVPIRIVLSVILMVPKYNFFCDLTTVLQDN